MGNVGIGTTAVGNGNRLEITGGAIAAGNGGELRMMEALTNGTNSVAFRAPTALANNYSMTLPVTIGATGQVLSTDGTGALSWVTAPVDGGTLLAASGNAGSPGIAFQADTDTGIWNPGANTLAISTAGTSRISINNSGNVGIGTTSPATKLQIAGALQATAGSSWDWGSSGVGVTVLYDQPNDRGVIQSSDRGGIAMKDLLVEGNAIRFGTHASNPVERMTIMPNGNVGIGTTAVGTGNHLEVTGGAIAAGNGGELRMMEALTNGTNSVAFRAPTALANNYSMTLPGSIGSPGQVLMTDGTGALSWTTASSGVTFPLLSTTRGSAATAAYSFSSDTDTGIYSPGSNQLGLTTSGTSRIHISGDGKIGVATTNPNYQLDVSGSIGASEEIFSLSAFETGGYVSMWPTTNSFTPQSQNAAIYSSSSTGGYYPFLTPYNLVLQSGGATAGTDADIVFVTNQNPAVRMVVKGNGSVGIGTIAPSQLLSVNGGLALSSSGTAAFLPPISGNYAMRLPGNIGSPGQVLMTDGTGSLSWGTVASGGGASQINDLNDAIYNSIAKSLYIGESSGTTSTNAMTANTAVGFDTLSAMDNSSAIGNTAIGHESLKALTSGNSNTGLGVRSLRNATTSTANAALGSDALLAITTGSYNSSIGNYSFAWLTTQSLNAGLGDAAGAYVRGSNNVAVGARALQSNWNLDGNAWGNVAIGFRALPVIHQASSNVAVGEQAFENLSTGNYNIGIGDMVGSGLYSGSNNILIGHQINVPSGTISNYMSIGNLIYSDRVDGSGTTPSTGSVGIGTSTLTARLTVNGNILASGAVGSEQVTYSVAPASTYPVSGGIDTRLSNTFEIAASGAGNCPTVRLDFTTMRNGLHYTLAFTGFNGGTCGIQDENGTTTNVRFHGGAAPTLTGAEDIICTALKVGSRLYLSCLNF